MENKTLTPQQIKHLHEFCEFHNVKYYDVQIELVDHLASAIEKRWETNPKLTFEDALVDVAEQFGVDPNFHISFGSLLPQPTGYYTANNSEGFDNIRAAKEKELWRKYNRIQRKYIGDFFKLPKILLTFLLAFIVYFLLQQSGDAEKTSLIIVGLYFVILLLFLFAFYPNSLRWPTSNSKPFLLFKHYKSRKWQTLSAFWGIINLLVLCTNLKSKMGAQISNLLFAALFSFFIIVSFVTTIYIPRRIKEDFQNEFPQFTKA